MRTAAALLLLLLGGCAQPGPELGELRGRHGGTLRLAAQNDIRTLDTAIGYDIDSWRFERLIFAGLLNYGEDATLVPDIARAMPEVEAGRKFTFHLRDDVWFHPMRDGDYEFAGRKVRAQDFKYAIERVLNPETTSPAGSLFETIVGAKDFVKGRTATVAGLQCPDDLTLVVELTQPDLAFLNVITMPFAYAIPPEVVERYDLETWPRHAVGAGPYRLARWEPGLGIRVERFDRYHRRDERAFVDAVEMRFGIPDFMQLMMFERGEIELSGIPLPDIQRIHNSPKYRAMLHTEPDNAVFYCSMNCEMPPFDNQKLRQAFNYAVDKERICRILAGTAQPATGVLPPGMPGYNPELKGYPYDPARAKQLLAEAGYPDGLEVELTTRSRPAEQRWAEVVMQNLRDIGVRCSIRSIAFPQWLDVSGKRKGLAFTINAWFQDYPDPSNFLDILLNGERITETNSNNRAFYNNPEVNALLNQAAGMTDVEARLKLYQRVEAMVVDDAPWIFVYYPTRQVLVQPWLKNYKLHPVWSSRDDTVWFGRGEESAR